MASLKAKEIVLKFLSLFSAVRGYNILVLICAQYLAAIFIFSPAATLQEVLLDLHLLYLVLATIFVVAGGYIINNFYDVKVDLINRPVKAKLDGFVHQTTKLKLYFLLNFIGFCFGALISFKAGLFFALFIFGIWLYSHKLKKHPFLGVLTATFLTVLPFLAVFVYFENYSKIIFVHAIFLFLVVMVRQLVKDLQNIKGAMANNYNTFTVVYGVKKTKSFALFLLILTIVPTVILLKFGALSYMRYYFYFATLLFVLIGFYLWRAKTINQFRVVNNILKLLLFVGVLCLLFIDTALFLDKVINRLN